MLRRVLHRLGHLRDRPFASAMGVLFVSSAVVALADLSLTADALSQLVPWWFLDILSLTYGVSGLFLLLGMMFERGDWEAAGCVLALSGLTVRGIAVLVVLGVTPGTIALIMFYVVFALACIERLRQIIFGEKIIHVVAEVKLKPEGGSS